MYGFFYCVFTKKKYCMLVIELFVMRFMGEQIAKNNIKLSTRKISYAMLNLLEFLLSKKRGSIRVECSKRNIILNDYESVALYIKQKL